MTSNTYGRQVVIPMTNGSGGSVIAGDVVIVKTTANLSFTTTTSAGFTGMVGVAQETIANAAIGRVLLAGYAALINVNASVTRGDFGATHTVAKQAADFGAARGTGTFCQFLTGGATPDAVVYPVDLLGTSLTNPMTTKGDSIQADTGGTPVRTAAGTAGYIWTAGGAAAFSAWAAPAAASDPTIPSGGTLYAGTSTSGWTTFGTPDTFDANSTIPGAFYLQKTTMGSNNLVGAYRAVSSLPRTYTMKVLDGFFHANYHSISMVLAEAVPGKFFSWGAVFDTPHHYFQRYAWTTAAAAGANTNYPVASTGTMVLLPTWYRIVVNSSTDIEVWQSLNGYIYYRFAAAINPGFTVGNFGFAMATFAGIEMKAAIDWIHET